jgi:hypothetical protein
VNSLSGIVAFTWLEPGDNSRVENLFKGLASFGNEDGSPVSGADKTILQGDWSDKKFYPFARDHQNGNGNAPTVNSVTASVDGALVEGDDFLIIAIKNTKNGL